MGASDGGDVAVLQRVGGEARTTVHGCDGALLGCVVRKLSNLAHV